MHMYSFITIYYAGTYDRLANKMVRNLHLHVRPIPKIMNASVNKKERKKYLHERSEGVMYNFK